MHNFWFRLALICLIFILDKPGNSVLAQYKQVDESLWVDPRGYPHTLMDYLRCVDAFLGGSRSYDLVDESRVCISTLQDDMIHINFTMKQYFDG